MDFKGCGHQAKEEATVVGSGELLELEEGPDKRVSSLHGINHPYGKAIKKNICPRASVGVSVGGKKDFNNQGKGCFGTNGANGV